MAGLNVKIKYFNDVYGEEGIRPIDGNKSDWIDLRCAETIELRAGDFKILPLGVAMELPKSYEAYVVPRSSTFKNFGIIQANSFGMIDNSYNGPNDQWRMPVLATRDITIHAGDRIAQFRIMLKQPQFNFVESTLEENESRGGIGSTGIN